MLSLKTVEKIVGISPDLAEERLSQLTPRESEIIDLLTAGAKPRVVAEKLGISPKTIDIHRANIKRKLGVRSDIDMVKFVLIRRLASAIAKR